MQKDIDTVRAFYDTSPETEYNRLENRPEFLITARWLARYLKRSDRVLDIGGGPGRYSLHLARMVCDVTLVDLSGGNVAYAKDKAREQRVPLTAYQGNALEVDRVVSGTFDHVLLMGPLYHLLEEPERVQAVEASLRVLKPGGTLWAAFISMHANLHFLLRDAPEIITSLEPADVAFCRAYLNCENYGGDAFTRAYFIQPCEIDPFMARFPLVKLHLFGQESILTHLRPSLSALTDAAQNAWLDYAEQLAEREDLLPWAEHLMYVGRLREPHTGA
ncbi:MAG: class I SAM-dependent methyltransferase [Clostridiales bacterium]|nr:class I SAM-dependent methyltransferase [Clostridiales bacterium]